MKNLFTLLFLSFITTMAYAQLPVTESFESDGESTRYESNEFTVGCGTDWFRRTQNSTCATASHSFNDMASGASNINGTWYFGGSDIDEQGAGENPLPGVDPNAYIVMVTEDVSAFTDIQVVLKLAGMQDFPGVEAGDFIKIEYAFDGNMTTGANCNGCLPANLDVDKGTYTTVGAFYGGGGAGGNQYFQDTDLNGSGDGTVLNATFQDFTCNFSTGGATNMSIRIQFEQNAGSEDAAVDHIRVTGSAAGCMINSLAAGTQGNCNPANNTYTQNVVVNYSNDPGSGMLNVNGQLFAITGSPQTVTLTGLTANALPVDVTAFFTDETTCTLTELALFTAPPSCLPCDISAIAAGAQTACTMPYNHYTQTLTITYEGAPTTGALVVNGQAFPITGSPQIVTLVNLCADGQLADATAYFSDEITCTFTVNNAYMAPTACEPCPPNTAPENIKMETFETDGLGVRYQGNFFATACGTDWFRRDMSNFCNNIPPNSDLDFALGNPQGTWYIAGDDVEEAGAGENPLGDGERAYVVCEAFDVEQYDTVEVKFFLAAKTTFAAFESLDHFFAQYAFDANNPTGVATAGDLPIVANVNSGLYLNGAAFYGNDGDNLLYQDPALDGPGGTLGTQVTESMQQFTYQIPVTGNLMTLRFVIGTDSVLKDIAFDQIMVTGITKPSNAVLTVTCPPNFPNIDACFAEDVTVESTLPLSDGVSSLTDETTFTTTEGGTIVSSNAIATITYQDAVMGGPVNCPITVTRTFTVTDVCGIIETCIQVFTIEDTTNPVINCPADPPTITGCVPQDVTLESALPYSTVLALINSNQLTVEGGSWTDNCNPQFMIQYQDVAMGSDPIIVTRTYTVTDICGNTDDCIQTFTIALPVVALTINAPPLCIADPSVVLGGGTPTGGVYSDSGLGVTDDANGMTFTFDPTASAPGGGNIPVTYTYTDGNGCSNSAIDNISVNPICCLLEVTCPTSTDLGTFDCTNIGNLPALPVDSTDATESPYNIVFGLDPCGTILIEASDDIMIDSCGTVNQTITRTIFIWDDLPGFTPGVFDAGDEESTSCTYTYVWIPDTEDPTITCPDDPPLIEGCGPEDIFPTSMLPLSLLDSTITPSQFMAEGGTVSDNCGILSITYSDVINGGACPWEVARTFLVLDNCMNQEICIQIFFIDDTTAPDAPANPADINVQCAEDVPPPVDMTAPDACDGPITVPPTAMIQAGACPNQFTMVRTWTFTDGCDNTSTTTQTINVFDDTAPVLSAMPANTTVECDAIPPVPTITAIDNCMNIQPVIFINEFHYDNTGGDVGEFIEVAGTAGTDLSTCELYLYNGSNGTVYNVTTLSGVIDDEGSGFGAVHFTYLPNGIQNGNPDGIALVCNGVVVEFISYEGTITAANGPAMGMMSTDIGVSEPGAVGESLQLNGTGCPLGSFTWAGPLVDSPGDLNAGQVFDTTLCPTSNNVPVSFDTVLIPSNTCPQEFTMLRIWTAEDDCANSVSHTQSITVIDTTVPEFCDPPADSTVDCVAPPAEDLFATDNCDFSGMSSSVWVNEFHYDNTGGDVNEFIEIAGVAGTNLSGYRLYTYNGSNGQTYNAPMDLSGIIPNETCNRGALSFSYPSNGLQNGSPDGFALVQGTTVIEFLSYEGSFMAVNGPAMGMNSTNVGVSETGGTPVGSSLQLTGTGASPLDFAWTGPDTASPGSLNTGQIMQGNLLATLDEDDQSTLCDGGTVTRTWTVEDACGNAAVPHVQVITVIPPAAPLIVCPPDMTVQCEADIVVDAANAMVTTDCNLGFVTWVDQPHITGARDCNGTTYEYLYHVVDDCGRGATCIQTITIVNDPPTITLPNCGTSDASDTVYDNFTWNSGDNDGSGFGGWILNPPFSDNFAGHFVFTSTENGDGIDTNGDNDIDRIQRAWGFYANSGNLSEAIRPLTQSLVLGSSLSFNLDNGFVDFGGTVGVGFQNSSGGNLLEFFFVGGDANYTIQDASGSINTNIPFTNEGLKIELDIPLALIGIDPFLGNLTITPALTGQSQTFPVELTNVPGGQVISQVRFFNFNAGSGPSQNLYANSLQVCNPIQIDCYDDIVNNPSDATVTTSCGEVLPVTIYSPEIIGEPNCPGTIYSFTYRVEDQCEREATIDKVFVVGDNAPPTIVAPADVTCECLAGVNAYGANATVTTACNLGYDVSVSDPVISGPIDCPGTTYTYTYTVKDACGREAEDTQVFTVVNDGPQFVNAPTVPLQLNCEDQGWEYVIQAWLSNVQATTSCSQPLTVFNNYNPNNQGLCISNGTTVVTFTAQDQCGRSSQTTGMIIIADTEPPVFVEEAQDELDICNYNTQQEFAAWVAAHGNAEALDGCWGTNLNWSTIPNNPSINCIGQMGSTSVTVTFVARDGCGNKASTTATFTALMTGGDLVEDEEGEAEAANDLGFSLYQNQPNPFKNETLIGFNLPKATSATLTIFDVSGRVLRIVEGDYSEGYNEIQISRSELGSPGMLYYELKTATDQAIMKMILLD